MIKKNKTKLQLHQYQKDKKITATGKEEEKEIFIHIDGSVNQHSNTETGERLLNNQRAGLLYDAIFPHLSVHLKEIKINALMKHLLSHDHFDITHSGRELDAT